MRFGYPLGMAKHPKRPRDPNQLAKAVVDLATMDEEERAALLRRQEADARQKPGKRGLSPARGAGSAGSTGAGRPPADRGDAPTKT